MTKSKTFTQMPNKFVRVLGIDPGFDRCGIAILEGTKQKQKLLYSECIVTDRKAKHEERLLTIGDTLQRIIKKWKPDALAMEKLFFNQNVNTALKVAEARGIALLRAAEKGLSVSEYSPQDVKIAVTGYGKADKRQVERMTLKKIGRAHV